MKRKEATINVYEAKDGWRWRLLIGDNIKAVCTDTHKTEESALQEARELICSAWYEKSENDEAPKKLKHPSIWERMLQQLF